MRNRHTRGALHEDLSRTELVRPASDRAFGLVLAGALGVIAVLPMLYRHPVRVWALSAALAAAAVNAPRLLQPLNRQWVALAHRLGVVTTPVVLAVVYAVAILPTAAVMRLARRDPLHRRFDRARSSYWIPRSKSALASSMTHQY